MGSLNNRVKKCWARSFAALLIRGARRGLDRHNRYGAYLLLRCATKFNACSHALARLGTTATELGRYRNAAVAFREAIRIFPMRPHPHARIARFYAILGYKRSADDSARAALAIDPSCAAAHLVLASIGRDERRQDEVIERIGAAINHGRSREAVARAYRQLADLCRDQQFPLVGGVTRDSQTRVKDREHRGCLVVAIGKLAKRRYHRSACDACAFQRAEAGTKPPRAPRS